jgi:ATP-binding cassette subfamily B protein
VAWNAVRRIFRREWRLMDRVNSLLQDILSGIRVVKAYGKEEWEIGRFRQGSLEVRNITEKNEKIWAGITPFLSFALGIGNFLVLYYGGRLVLGEQLALGELVQFSEYARMLYAPLAWIGAIPKMFVEAMVAAERIFEVTDSEPEVKESGKPRRHTIRGSVRFDSVTFGYLSHEPVLDGISLSVEPGEMIGLVGHSGAGKSTLINLLLRLYDVDEGSISIDGMDIREVSLQDLRRQIGVVLQETFLFSGSILENIRYAKPGAAEAEAIRAAKVAHAHDFVVHFPDGYDTRVGEKGMRLSGGERQRIAIARAILHDPRILILDEATSSVDTETEEKIQEALLHLVRNRTTFAIAHRLATLRHADRLVVLDQGRLAEQGTHRELMAGKGQYYRLVTAQRRMSRNRGVSG